MMIEVVAIRRARKNLASLHHYLIARCTCVLAIRNHTYDSEQRSHQQWIMSVKQTITLPTHKFDSDASSF